MKRLFLFFLVLLTAVSSHCQPGDYKCPCSKIGIDNLWADSNKVSCYLIPVLKATTSPSNGKIYIATVFGAALNKTNEKPLLYLHGGPGIATLENVPRFLQSKIWKGVRETRPIVFFDYRGTGFSEPALCRP